MTNMASGCAWCSPSNGGTDGICDDCMQTYFGVDPASIHAEIEEEEAQAMGWVITATEAATLALVQDGEVKR